jgi:hypothetical protein
VEQLGRIAPLAGVAAAVLWVVGVVVLEAGGNPADPDRAEEIVEFYRDERTTILVAGLLHVLGGFFFLWFLGVVGAALGDPDPRLRWLRTAALAGGTAAAALMLALTGSQTTGATTDEELLGPETSVAFWRLGHGFFIGAEVAFAVFVGALSLLALTRVLLPRWLGWFGLVVTAILLVPPVGWIALLLLVPIWVAIASVVLYRRPPARGRPADMPAS